MILFLLILYMVFGLVFYDLPYFQMVDEIFPILLFVISLIYKGKINKRLILFGVIATFYLIYSFLIKSNVPKAILFDFICFSKPFLTLFSVMVLNPVFTVKDRQIIRIVVLLMIPVLIYAGINVYGTDETIEGQLLSGARYSFCCVYLGLTYYLFSKNRPIDYLVLFFFITLGILFPTSKYFALVLIVCCVFLLTRKKKLKLGVKSLALFSVAAVVIVLLVFEDIELYLSEDVARGAMYLAAREILLDYIPFGSGLASFSTPASATFYSNTYYDYSLDGIYGLTPSNPVFCSDSFLPSFAEFGFVGIVLFALFIFYLYRKGRNCGERVAYRVGMIIIADLIIESVSDVSIIGNRGVYAMILLGLILSPRGMGKPVKQIEDESSPDK